ncbi:MAG: gliding motility-associated C-terminal domain-containing protein [Cyclobacteriaceae bacterium]
MNREVLIKYYFLASMLSFGVVAQAQIVSSFDTNIDGWTAAGSLGDLVSHIPSGGNPGGYISATPTWTGTIGVFPVYFYFSAPTKFLGNFSSYYNGNITFDLRQGVLTTAVVRPEVILSDGITPLYYFPPTPFNPPTSGWTTYSVTLSASSGYWKTTNSDTGPAATALQIQTVLSNITVFAIRGRFNSVASPPATSLDNVVMQPPITITTHPIAQSVCNGATASLTAAATGNNNITYRWQIFNATAYFDLNNSAVYSGVSTPTLNINTAGMMGAGSYRCRVSGTNTPDVPTMAVMVTVNAPPLAPSATGAAACGSSAITLNASGGSAGQYRWYTVPTLGTPIAGQTNSAYTTPVISGTTTYYVSINNGTCESTRTSVVATINSIPAAPGATGNAACGSSAITLNASGGSAGQYRWYTVSTGGTPIAGQTNSAYTTPVISGTTTYYVSINNGTCESARTPVVATINNIPAAPGATGNAACGPSAITLNASGGSAGQYRWYTVSTGGTPIAGQTNSAYTTPVIAGTTTYYVSINNGTCESTRTSVTATINTIPTAPGSTGNSSCGSSAITLNASGGSAGQYRWYTVSTGGTAISGEAGDSYTTPLLNSTTPYYVSLNDGVCESTRVMVEAIINTIPSSPTTTGASNCEPSSLVLSASGATNGEYVWYDVPSGGTPITGEVNATYTTPVLNTTTAYYVAINNGFCESSRKDVTATIGGAACTNSPPQVATSSTSTTIAGVATIDLTTLISDPDNNLDLSTLKILISPISNAIAQINNMVLTINYSGLTFSGRDRLTIEICDQLGSCTQQEIIIDVGGDLNIYSGISPNRDPFNEKWIIQNIESLPETKSNHVSIFNRWGDVVFEVDNYDNNQNVFIGLNKNGDDLSSGIYFYKIEFSSGLKTQTGYLTLKR